MLLNRVLRYFFVCLSLSFVGCLSYPVIWNYLAFRSTLNVILSEKMGLKAFTIKEQWIDGYIVDPDGYFWVVLDKGFDPDLMNRSQISFTKIDPHNPDLRGSGLIIPQEYPQFVRENFNFEASDFEGDVYVAGDFYVGSGRLCPEFTDAKGRKITSLDMIKFAGPVEIAPPSCKILFTVRQGDKNVFISLSSF
jgi:hypothetical protein